MALVGQLVGEVAVDVVLADPAVVVGVAARHGEVAAPVDVVARAGRAAALQPFLHVAEVHLHVAVVLHGGEDVPDGVLDELVGGAAVGAGERDHRGRHQRHDGGHLEDDVHHHQATALLLGADEAAARHTHHEHSDEDEHPGDGLRPVHVVVEQVVVGVAQAGDAVHLHEEPDGSTGDAEPEHHVQDVQDEQEDGGGAGSTHVVCLFNIAVVVTRDTCGALGQSQLNGGVRRPHSFYNVAQIKASRYQLVIHAAMDCG